MSSPPLLPSSPFHGKPLKMGPRVGFRHAPDVTTVIAGSLKLPRSPWDAHSLCLCSAQPPLMALCRCRGGRLDGGLVRKGGRDIYDLCD
jgi:hypothetical protein